MGQRGLGSCEDGAEVGYLLALEGAPVDERGEVSDEFLILDRFTLHVLPVLRFPAREPGLEAYG